MASNVRRLRHAASISQEELAHRAGVNRAYLSTVESARRNLSLDVLAALARALEVDMLDLLRHEEPDTQPDAKRSTHVLSPSRQVQQALSRIERPAHHFVRLARSASPPTSKAQLLSLPHIELDDALFGQMEFSLSWLRHEPSEQPPSKRFIRHSSHTIPEESAAELATLLDAWRTLWSLAPDPIALASSHLIHEGQYAGQVTVLIDKEGALSALSLLSSWLRTANYLTEKVVHICF